MGVDPGLSGAIVMIDGDKIVGLWDMPLEPVKGKKKGKARIDVAELGVTMRAAAQGFGVKVAVIERVGAAPGQGAGSTFKFGEALGLVRGAVSAAGIKEVLVHPSEWKAAMRLGSDKDRARQAAMTVWPGSRHVFEKKAHDGRAEAALLALWGLRSGRVLETSTEVVA